MVLRRPFSLRTLLICGGVYAGLLLSFAPFTFYPAITDVWNSGLRILTLMAASWVGCLINELFRDIQSRSLMSRAFGAVVILGCFDFLSAAVVCASV